MTPVPSAIGIQAAALLTPKEVAHVPDAPAVRVVLDLEALTEAPAGDGCLHPVASRAIRSCPDRSPHPCRDGRARPRVRVPLVNDMPIKTGFMFPVTAELFEQFTRPSTVMSLIEGEILNDLGNAHRVMTDPLYRRHGPVESDEHKCARFGHEFDDGDGYDIDGDPDEDDRITFRCWRCRAVVAEFTRTTT